MSTGTIAPQTSAPPIPRSFWEYVRSFGPGIVIVLTWLGAGDVVGMGTSGSHYGYSLMWMLVVALVMRFLFVSLIARYQLCNQHGEGVLDGLARLHPWYAPLLFFAVIVLGHVYGAYMTVGVGEVWRDLTGVGRAWHWALLFCILALVLVFQPKFRFLEWTFMLLLGLLSVGFVGSAIWVGFEPFKVLQGLYRFEMPGEQHGTFKPLLLAIAMIGAVGGSLMNLVYPYFLDAKGWRGPQYRRVQTYDLLLGIVIMIVLNLAVWTLGAKLLYPFPQNQEIKLEDLAGLLSRQLGSAGRTMFYLGVFAAIYTSIIGHAVGLARMGSHAWLRWRAGSGPIGTEYSKHPLHRWILIWCIASPMIWPIVGTASFISFTLAANSAQVVLLPLLAGGLWWITADSRYIGREHRNRWWENLVMGILFVLAVWGAFQSVRNILDSWQH